MKYIKLFENFNQFRTEILEESKVIDILYDLKDLSLEYLDIKHKRLNEDDEEENLSKTIIFNVDLNSKEGYLGNLFCGQYNFENINIEENINWSDDITPKNLKKFGYDLKEGFKSNNLKISITFSIVIDEEGRLSSISDDSSGVYKIISDMYPDVNFDIFNPWDLN